MPGILKQARIRAVSSDKRLVGWLEEVIEEKVVREERDETHVKGCVFKPFGFQAIGDKC